MIFGWALKELQSGYAVTREGWNGKGQYLQLQVPDANSKMTKPYIYICTVQGDKVPWLASQTDLLAEDWCYAPERDSTSEGVAESPSAPTEKVRDFMRTDAMSFALKLMEIQGIEKTSEKLIPIAQSIYEFLSK